jgi:Restriction endonuclease
MSNLLDKATKDAGDLGHKLEAHWTTSQRGQSNHCLKCGRFVGVIYDPEEVYGTALNASREEVGIPQKSRLAESAPLTQELDASLIEKHRTLIDKFLEIAERKVAVIDDYGDENWDALDAEVERCVSKIARIEGEKAFDTKNGERKFTVLKPSTSLRLPDGGEWPKYANLWCNIEKEFRAYHEKCKSAPPAEKFDDFSGVDFEVYLAKLLKTKLGFEDVSGTPATGDQGADLIAIKDGRKIAIQAKRYAGVVGNRAVQEIVGALKFYKAVEGWVITSGTFTPSARALAQANGIHLVDGVSLRKLQQG